MAFLKSPLGLAIVAFLAVFVGGSVALNALIPTTCRDGWHSPSIGRKGACSWHGGVTDHGKGALTLLFSGAAAFGAFGWRGSRQRSTNEAPTPPPFSLPRQQSPLPLPPPRAPDGAVACPMCGALMVKRLARRGRSRGKEFWGCSQYPSCHGTRNIPLH